MDNKKLAYNTAYTLISNMNIVPSDKYTFKDRGWYFISGPMTGYSNWNAGAFYECEKALYHMIKSPYIYNPAKKIPNDNNNPKPHCYYMRHTLSTLSNYMFEDWLKIDVNKPLYDAIILLPGWERSNGAVLEAIVASECGVAVVEWVE
jgi:hypothetical protein